MVGETDEERLNRAYLRWSHFAGQFGGAVKVSFMFRPRCLYSVYHIVSPSFRLSRGRRGVGLARHLRESPKAAGLDRDMIVIGEVRRLGVVNIDRLTENPFGLPPR